MNSDISTYFPLQAKRVHEACGPSALGFAFALAGQQHASVLWVREAWLSDQINPAGFSQYLDPHRLLLAKGKGQAEVLASAEEALCSGAVGLTVIELTKPIGLTAGRRLQLAAETGKSTGLCILPDGMGSNAAQTRWRCEIIKNKSGTLTT